MFIFIYIACDINYDSAQSRWNISIAENMSYIIGKCFIILSEEILYQFIHFS